MLRSVIAKRFLAACLYWVCSCGAFLCGVSFAWSEDKISISVTVPDLDVDPYHRPYVALWLETEGRKPIETIALWVQQEDWLKDLRQWWRKLGRATYGKSDQLDSVTGATRKPGDYKLEWRLNEVPENNIVVLHLEASREEGGRSYHRQKIDLTQSAEFNFPADGEFGAIHIRVNQ